MDNKAGLKAASMLLSPLPPGCCAGRTPARGREMGTSPHRNYQRPLHHTRSPPLQVREHLLHPSDLSPVSSLTWSSWHQYRRKALPGRSTTPFIPAESPSGEMN